MHTLTCAAGRMLPLLAAVLAALTIACGGGDSSEAPTPGTAGEITEDAGPVPDAGATPTPAAT